MKSALTESAPEPGPLRAVPGRESRGIHSTGESPAAVILGGGSACLTAARNLAEHGIRVCIVGSRIEVSRFSRAPVQFLRLPRSVQVDDLPRYLIEVAKSEGLLGSVLFPTQDEQVRAVGQHHVQLGEHFLLTSPAWERARILYDKRLTYALASDLGIPLPGTAVPGDSARAHSLNLAFPVVVKPAITSRFFPVTNVKAYRADNPREFRARFDAVSRVVGASEVIVQELVPGPSRNLYSFAGYFRGGEPVAGLSVKRTRQFPCDFGRKSSFVEVVDVPELRSLSARLLRAIDYTGLAEVEFMWNERRCRYELLEVNARFWAWHGLAIDAGLELPYLAFAETAGYHPAKGVLQPGVKWIRFLTDLPAAASEICSGRLGFRQYVASLSGRRSYPLFSRSDPLPALVEPLLSLFDHLTGLASRHRERRRLNPEAGPGSRSAPKLTSGQQKRR